MKYLLMLLLLVFTSNQLMGQDTWSGYQPPSNQIKPGHGSSSFGYPQPVVSNEYEPTSGRDSNAPSQSMPILHSIFPISQFSARSRGIAENHTSSNNQCRDGKCRGSFERFVDFKLINYQRSDSGYCGEDRDPYGCLGESKQLLHSNGIQSHPTSHANPSAGVLKKMAHFWPGARVLKLHSSK